VNESTCPGQLLRNYELRLSRPSMTCSGVHGFLAPEIAKIRFWLENVGTMSHRIHGAGIYANIWGILMGSMLPYIAYMDPMGV
jgi:hypothetical protein